jgi:uncharacterized membrane protein YagU involved in acid resistance
MWWRGAMAGCLGGVLAAGAMSVAHKAFSAIAPPAEAPAAEGDDATVKTAEAILRRPLPDDRKLLAGTLVHYAFGGSVGAVYGAVAEIVPRVTRGFGVPVGLAVWLGAHAITVPALGLAPPPTRRPLSKEAPEFVMHVLYGLVTEAARRLLRGRS